MNTLSRLADCLVCRQNEGMGEVLRAGLGTAPPDLPPNTVGSSRALFCQKQILSGMQKGVLDVVKTLARCEVENVTAAEPVECDTSLASARDAIQAKVDAVLSRCVDSSGVLACPFDGGATGCLGDASDAVGETLVDAIFGLEE